MTQIAKSHNISLSVPLSAAKRFCRHCQGSIPTPLPEDFCCHGCRSAFALIESFELDRFYEIVQQNRDVLRPAEVYRVDYRLFDTPEFQKDFVEGGGPNQQSAHFYLNNLSCYACVWVCEQVTRHIDPKARLAINLSNGSATLDFSQDQVGLSEFFSKFEALGYKVSPNREFQQDSHTEIARIGVALFCLTNIMMLAFPEYLGASSLEDRFRDLFRWISTALAALSVFYAGWPFLKGAVYSLKNREIHLDLPIGLALVVCYFYSFVNTVRGHPHVYYDSTAAVVALLLIGRWVQASALRSIAREQSRFFESDTRFARLVQADGTEQLVGLSCLESGCELRILPGEVVPLECMLLSPQAEINYSLLTGEAANQAIAQGTHVRAGAVNGSLPIHVRSLEAGIQSFLLKLQQASQELYRHKGHYLGLSESMAKGFVSFVLGMATLVFAWNWQYSAEQAITRFATLLLIACPCIFGFGAPLVLARAMTLGIQRGVLFRSQKSLERLTLVRLFFFDKTGTLTEDESQIGLAEWNRDNLQSLPVDLSQIQNLLWALPHFSQHHTLAALARWVGSGLSAAVDVKAVREIFGQGISLVWQGFDVRIGRLNFCLSSAADQLEALEYSYLSIQGKSVLRFKLEDRLRPDAVEAVQELQKGKRELYILTGDSLERARKVGDQLGIQRDHVLAALDPHDKLDRIGSNHATAMVGNGINDALALARVEIGIAMANATDALKERADINLLAPGIEPLIRAIELSASTRRAMQRCFVFAGCFNVIGMTLAVTGAASPVIAAILMPISSLTIFAIARHWR